MADGATSTASVTGPNDPSQTSSEYKKMSPHWQLVTDVLLGATAMQRSPHYLPKYEGETQEEYDRRRIMAPWRPEFEDILRGLTSRPFSKDVSLKEGASSRMKELAENIDGRGNSLTAFAKSFFSKGIAKGLSMILVDYPNMHPAGEQAPAAPVTIAQERASGARPYWIAVEAENILALYTRWDRGVEVIEHVRVKEDFVQRNGFEEVTGTRIRVYEPGIWEVWERLANETAWSKKSDGRIARGGTKTSIPVVVFYTGERDGELLVKPPIQDLAQMQLELYRAQSREEEVLTFASSPMLTANGMKKPEDGGTIRVGPKSVLFAPAEGASWNYINPDADNVEQVRKATRDVIDDMNRLGMQPLVARTGRETATNGAIEAAKAHSAVQAWAIGLKDVLEQAFVFTAEWIGESANPEVFVYTDFRALPASTPQLQALATARAEGDISRRTFWGGLMRYDVLAPDFDPEAEEKLLEKERAEEPPPAPPLPKRDPVTGMAVPDPKNRQPEPAPTPTA